MPERLAVGAASGTVSALLVSLAQGLLANPPYLPEDITCSCPTFWPPLGFERAGFELFLAGLLLGLLAGPLLDIAWVVRDRWRRLILGLLTGGRSVRAPGSYRVLHE